MAFKKNSQNMSTFIVFSALDCSGKSTQIDLLNKEFKNRNNKVRFNVTVQINDIVRNLSESNLEVDHTQLSNYYK